MGERECKRWERGQRDRNAHANARQHRRLPTRRMNPLRQRGDERIARELALAEAVIIRFARGSVAPAMTPRGGTTKRTYR